MHLADEHSVILNEMKAFIKDNPSPCHTKLIGSNMIFTTMWYVQSAKAKTSLRIYAVL